MDGGLVEWLDVLRGRGRGGVVHSRRTNVPPVCFETSDLPVTYLLQGCFTLRRRKAVCGARLQDEIVVLVFEMIFSSLGNRWRGVRVREEDMGF